MDISVIKTSQDANLVPVLVEILAKSSMDLAKYMDKSVHESLCVGDKAFFGYNRMAFLSAQHLVEAVEERFVVMAVKCQDNNVEVCHFYATVSLRRNTPEITVQADGIVFVPRKERPWWRFWPSKAELAAEDKECVAEFESAAKEFFNVNQ